MVKNPACFSVPCGVMTNVIILTEPAQRFVDPFLKAFRKEVISDRRERGSHSHAISLLIKLPTNGEVLFCGTRRGVEFSKQPTSCKIIWEQMSGNVVISEVGSLSMSD
jgi:hypothetical protein